MVIKTISMKLKTVWRKKDIITEEIWFNVTDAAASFSLR